VLEFDPARPVSEHPGRRERSTLQLVDQGTDASDNAALDLRSHPIVTVPRALADLYDRTSVGDRCDVRFAKALDASVIEDFVVGAGFTTIAAHGAVRTIERARTLPDRVGVDLRVLLCGLNPSIYAADAGVGFARPGNRFWPAVLASGLLTRDRDPRHALDVHRVGMTDLVKRATARANELDRSEYTAGAARVQRLCALLAPRVLCVVGLTGWRIAVDRRATTGVQHDRIATTLVYVMPNPSGLNAHDTVTSLAEHLRTAARGPVRG
jgi:TDG/mug DNA glycosylase family protein